MKLEKSTKQLESSPINMFTCEEDLLKASSRLLYLWFWKGILKGIKEFLFERDFYTRKGWNFYSYKFCYKFAFILFLHLAKTKNENQILSKLLAW